MNTASIVLPDQLSLENEVIKNSKKYDFLVFFEPVNFLYEYKHHKHKHHKHHDKHDETKDKKNQDKSV